MLEILAKFFTLCSALLPYIQGGYQLREKPRRNLPLERGPVSRREDPVAESTISQTSSRARVELRVEATKSFPAGANCLCTVQLR